jgi:hypothetical protein
MHSYTEFHKTDIFQLICALCGLFVKDENGHLLADSHNIVKRWKNYFSPLLNVHRVSAVRQTEIHTAEPLVSDPEPF